jgi:hypothetical protein
MPIISSAMVAAIGTGNGFAKGRMDMTCSLVFGAPCQLQSLAGRSTVGPSH